jgi:NAD(P)H dehydrogenase (quinone)
MPVKLAIVFYSTYGTNHAIAETAAEAARAAGADVRLLRAAETAPQDIVEGQDAWKAQAEKMSDIPIVSHADMEWADAYFFSVPTRYGAPASQMRAFIDTLGGLWFEGKLANKAVTATTSAQNTHGGQETTLLSLYTTFMHWGAILVPPGYTDQAIFAAGGNPYGYSHTAGPLDDKAKAAIAHQARRLVSVAQALATDQPLHQAA